MQDSIPELRLGTSNVMGYKFDELKRIVQGFAIRLSRRIGERGPLFDSIRAFEQLNQENPRIPTSISIEDPVKYVRRGKDLLLLKAFTATKSSTVGFRFEIIRL
jgi:hypothetical protein